jgi:hypothetical protein
MKNIKLALFLIAASLFLFTSCATIVGGSKYNAHVEVTGRPNAKIYYNGNLKGSGNATFKVRRNEANKFTFTVLEDGCNEQKYNFTSHTFRGWALAGSIISWTSSTGTGIPLPFGVIVDLATGAYWKPDVKEKGVSKQNYKNFKYTVSYYECTQKNPENNEQFTDIIYLKNGTVFKGKIIERIFNDYIKFETKLGNVFFIKLDEIDKMTKE